MSALSPLKTVGLAGTVLCLLPLPAYATGESVLVIQPVYWQADAPCDAALSLDLETLTGGSPRDRDSETDLAERVFRPSPGGRITIEAPEIVTYDVFGEDYAAVFTDLVERRPLESRRADLASGGTVMVAMIETQVALSTLTQIVSGPAQQTDVTLLEDRFAVRISPRISLARWVGYDSATPEQRSLWDRARCENIHHELGHLFITAELFEANIGAALGLQADSADALSQDLEAWFQSVVARVDARQERYHDEIRKMGVAAANSRPYRDLDFPWLDADGGLTD